MAHDGGIVEVAIDWLVNVSISGLVPSLQLLKLEVEQFYRRQSEYMEYITLSKIINPALHFHREYKYLTGLFKSKAIDEKIV